MEDITVLESILEKGKKVLLENNAVSEKVYITFGIGIYNAFKPEQWAEYLKRYNYKIVIKIISDDAVYIVTKDGKLKKLELESALLDEGK